MERQLVSEIELIKILNAELAKYEECKNCHFDAPPVRLVEPDKDGCNWSTIYLRCSGVPAEICAPFSERIVLDAKKKYNLK